MSERSRVTSADCHAGSGASLLGGDTRAERELLRRGAENEAKMRGIIGQQRAAIGEQRAMLEKKCAAEQGAAKRHNEDAAELRVEIARAAPDAENHELKEQQAAIDATEAGIWDADAKLAELRREEQKLEESERSEREISKCRYKLTLGLTGVRWDTEAPTAAGYVALEKAKHFEVPLCLSRTEAADEMWKEIESCLPASAALPKLGGA